jgi:CRP-like cAMP-binding protein
MTPSRPPAGPVPAPEADPLAGVELFAGLSDAQRGDVAAIGEERDAEAGDVLFRAGEEATALYVIQRGRVELTFPLVVMGEPRDTRFQSLERGRTLEWSALGPPHRLTMRARVATHAELLALPRARLQALLEDDPRLGHLVMANVARVVATRLHELLALWVREVQRNVAQTYR